MPTDTPTRIRAGFHCNARKLVDRALHKEVTRCLKYTSRRDGRQGSKVDGR
jgi:hypothetical protein